MRSSWWAPAPTFKTMPIEELLRPLPGADSPVWDDYALRAEPLIGRLTPELRTDLLAMAHETGKKLAAETLERFPGRTPEEILAALGVAVQDAPGQDEGSYNMFACYEEPATVTVWQKTIDAAEALMEEEGCAGIFPGPALRQVLLGHELYHYYEYSRSDLATSQKVLTLWKVGKFENRSRVSSLGEVGAMTFTRALLGLAYSPYVLDVVLSYPFSRRMARELSECIAGLAARRAGEREA